MDTREHFDKRIIEQIQEIFEKRINHLDAILVVIPLSTTRLTEVQKEVFSNITRMFGEDVAENILIAITWDDGGKETCLTVLRAAKVPINETFRFNNASVLVKYPSKTEKKLEQTSNETVKKSQRTLDEKEGEPQETSNVKEEEPPQKITEYMHSMYKSLWDERKQSFSKLFKIIEKMPRTTVKSSFEIMRARYNLEIRLASLKEEITEQAQLVANYVQDKDLLFRIKHETPENKKKALYSEIGIEMQPQYYGKSSLNCRKCRKTCHTNCWVPINRLNRTCEAMENNNCTVCEGRCGLNDHSLEKYVYEPQYVTKLYSGEDVVNRQTEREIAFSRFKQILGETRDLIDLLNEKALEKNVLTLPIFIKNIISKENKDNNPGFQLRIHLLQKICDYLKLNDSLWKISIECLS